MGRAWDLGIGTPIGNLKTQESNIDRDFVKIIQIMISKHWDVSCQVN